MVVTGRAPVDRPVDFQEMDLFFNKGITYEKFT